MCDCRMKTRHTGRMMQSHKDKWGASVNRKHRIFTKGERYNTDFKERINGTPKSETTDSCSSSFSPHPPEKK